MGLGAILILLLLLVSLVAFIWIIVLTAQGWGWLNTTLLCTLFVECWIFMIFSAGVQATRVKFTADAHKEEQRLTQAESRTQALEWGNFTPGTVNLDAAVPVKNELKRQTGSRGRAWRGLTIVNQAPDKYDLALAAPAAADEFAADGGAAPVVNSDSLPPGLPVFAFSEAENEQGQGIPDDYLGEFVVEASQGGQITLKPSDELTEYQKTAIQKSVKWTLYELMPKDSHIGFAALGSTPTEEEAFGRMDEDQLTALFAKIPEERRQKVIDSYLRDGKRADAGDLPETIWVRLQVNEDFDVDVDSNSTADANQNYFDPLGRSIDSRLLRGGDGELKGKVRLSSSLKNGVLVKEEAASQWGDRVTVEERVYVRPLNDYVLSFANADTNLKDVAERIKLYAAEKTKLENSNGKGQQLIGIAQVTSTNLRSDLDNYRSEVSVLDEEVANAQQQLTDFRAELSDLYRRIQATSY